MSRKQIPGVFHSDTIDPQGVNYSTILSLVLDLILFCIPQLIFLRGSWESVMALLAGTTLGHV